MVLCCDRWTLFNPSSRLPRHRIPACIPLSRQRQHSDLPVLRDPSWGTHIHFYLYPVLVLAHVPRQTFLDFNAVLVSCRLVLCYVCLLIRVYQCAQFSSRKEPNLRKLDEWIRIPSLLQYLYSSVISNLTHSQLIPKLDVPVFPTHD